MINSVLAFEAQMFASLKLGLGECRNNIICWNENQII